MKRKLIIPLFTLIVSVCLVHSCYSQPALSKKQWLQDLLVLENAVYTKHIDPFWKNPKTKYETLFALIKNYINTTGESQLKSEIIMTGFAKILATTGDGHSGVSTKSRGDLFGLYSYNVSWFPEGLFVTRADESNKSILGGRVIKIDDTPIDEAKKLVNSVSPSYHEYGFKRFSPRYFESPAVLYGLGIAKSPQQVTLTLQNESGISTVIFQRQSLKENEKTKFVSLTDIAAYTLPLYRKGIRKNYWFEYMQEKKVLYLDYQLVEESKEESMEAFVKRLSETVGKEDVEKFVIDIRLNPGGDQFTAWPLLAYIFSTPKINQPGKLFVITGHNTFSAATAFLEALDTKTNCIIVGTPTADSPIYPAEDNTIVLPNCKMEVRLSDEMWNYSLDEDNRIIIEPDVSVVTTFKDYMQGKDPALEAVINYVYTNKQQTTRPSEKFIGRYLFGVDKTLEITNAKGVLRADIKGRLHTVLEPVEANKFKTGIKDVFFEFNNNELMIHYPGGNSKTLRKLSADELTAFDLILAKQFDKAGKAYEELKQKYPNNINLNGTNMAALAFYYLIETMDFNTASALIDIAIKLDPHSEVASGLAKGVKNFGKK